MIMKSQTNKPALLTVIILFTGLPIFFYATGDFPRRSLLKESISLLTIIGLCLTLTQFFLTRRGNSLLFRNNLVKVITIHKIFGYLFLCILLIHPFLLVVPRYFEAGVQPIDGFTTILSTYGNSGILSGIFAWCLMFILLGTALFRLQMPLSYQRWVTVHRCLSLAFIILACWHAIDLGRHTNRVFSAYLVTLTLCGILLLVKDYLSAPVLQSGRAQ